MNQSELLDLYQKIYLIRKCEQTICDLYSHDQMKTPVHLSIGAEAIAVGVLKALPKNSKVFGTYRNHAIYLARTGDVDGFFAEMYGKKTGVASGKSGSMHLSSPEKSLVMTSAVVSTTIPVAVGAALANQYQSNDEVVVVFFGDGAIEEGVFWESLNFAALKKLKIFFVCEDNDLAIHTPSVVRQGYKSLSEVVQGFHCSYLKIEGWDVSKVYEGTYDEFKKMKAQEQPSLIHLPYFRYSQHVGVFDDFAAAYRIKPNHEVLESQDPLLCTRQLLRKFDVSEKEQTTLENQIDQKISEAIKKAEAADYAEKASLYDGVYCK